MNLYTHYSFDTLSNSYLMGPDGGGDAVLFDPATFDVPLLELVEKQRYYVRHVVLTHCDETRLDGLRTLRRVYDCTVYAAHATVLGSPAIPVSDGEVLELCDRPFKAIAMPGKGSDSVAYHMDGFVFTGTAMSAGEYGTVANPYAKALLLEGIRTRILALPGETVILPCHGPPSTVALERETFPMEESMPGAASP